MVNRGGNQMGPRRDPNAMDVKTLDLTVEYVFQLEAYI